MYSASLVPIKIGPGFWSRVPGVGPGFYSLPRQLVCAREDIVKINYDKNEQRSDPYLLQGLVEGVELWNW